MAEFALGLTKTAVEGTLSLVKSAVEEEEKLRDKVQNDLVFISGEFEVMQSFLQVANRERATKDKVALALVRQIRTLAFDVEDCVEFVIHLDLDKPSRWGWLRRLWHTLNSCASPLAIFFDERPPLPLDVAVAEIKQIKARVEDVSLRNTRYNLILHGSGDNSDNKQPAMPLPAEELPYAAAAAAAAAAAYKTSSTAAFHALLDAWKATGKWSSNMCNLQQELLIAREGDNDLRVISVWGSVGGGGPGMVSILTNAYCDPEICKHFKIHVWVKVAHPFNHDEFVKSLMDQFFASSSHQANNGCVDFCSWMKADNLMKATNLMQQMREQRYLIVLEDVLTVAEWDVIRMYLPDSKNGSRVLLSTPHLRTALLCTGEPYQVLSELRNFSGDNQFLCAISKKEKEGKFAPQLLRGYGVMSVWGADDDDKSNLIDILYRGIINGWLEEIEGVVADKSDHVDMLYKGIRNRRRKFEPRRSSWVDVPNDPYDLKVFAQRLFLNFHSDDIRASEITKVGNKGEKGLIEWCRKFLLSEKEVGKPYIVVINGVRSKEEWDLIERTLFPSADQAAKAPGGCILVITEEETVAKHCVKKDHEHLAFNVQDLKADPSISALIKKGCWHYAISGRKGRLFYDRSKDAREWATKFESVGPINFDNKGKEDEDGLFPVFMVKGDGKAAKHGAGWTALAGVNSEKVVLRHAYYGSLFDGLRPSWVDMPRRRDTFTCLTDFYWCLLLDFYSDYPQAKEDIAVRLLEGTLTDPIQMCRELLRKENCLVVINALAPGKDAFAWNDIKREFSEQHIQSVIVVVACDSGDIRLNEELLEIKALPLMGTQQQDRMHMEYCRIFSTQKRYQDAIQWFQTRQPVGRDKELQGIMKSVLNNNFVSVWGISGLGKSTLVRTVYYTEIIYSSGPESSPSGHGRTEAFAWVDVPSPFNLTDFAWRLLLDFYCDDPQAKEAAAVSMMKEGRQVPILECCKVFRTGKCLVVIDGLRSKKDWDLIKATFLAEPIQGTIVVVTNEEEVAMHCVENNTTRTINITGLEANAALSLFKKIAWENMGPNSKEQMDERMELANKSIVPKCGGLPKVIAAIGASNPFWTWYSLSRNFMGTLETFQEFHGLRPLFSWMQSYFDACSDSIKPCIYYLSIFPPAEKKSIRRRRLLWRWIAEGYCRDTSDGRTCEENGENCISELINLSIIQHSRSNEVLCEEKTLLEGVWSIMISRPKDKVFCEINGFFYEYIISRPMEDNLVFSLEEGCSLNSTRAGQHLTIRSTWDRRDRIVYESIDFSRLRSLTVFGKWEPFFICSKKVNMRLLRVLDLEDAQGVTNEDLEQIAERLTRLKFLSLRGQTKIKYLPSSMGDLRQLQTLDIRNTSIETLPIFITKLQKLRYIRAGSTEVWDWEGEEDEASSSSQAVTNSPAPAAATTTGAGSSVQTPPPPTIGATPREGNNVSTAPDGSTLSCNNGARALVTEFLSKLRKSCGGLDNNSVRGVKVPAGIHKLALLHTLGVVSVNNGTASATSIFFEELKKLTQLRKLAVSGINKRNIKEFCEAISGHTHLISLSVEVDKDNGNLDELDEQDIPQPPDTIRSLKLHGHYINKLVVWIEKLHPRENCKLDLTIEKPEELTSPELSGGHVIWVRHLRIRPIQEGELQFGSNWIFTMVVEIECRSALHIKFDDQGYGSWRVEVLKVQFSAGSQSRLQISGLSRLRKLKEVWLKGYADANKQYMKQQIDEMELEEDQKRPVLKLVQPCST